jgi:hypothetical protein
LLASGPTLRSCHQSIPIPTIGLPSPKEIGQGQSRPPVCTVWKNQKHVGYSSTDDSAQTVADIRADNHVKDVNNASREAYCHG